MIFRGVYYDIPNLHTKQLLNLKNSVRKYHCSCCSQYEDENGKFHSTYPKEVTNFLNAIRTELGSREHVLNKKEVKLSIKNSKKQGRKKPSYVR